MNNHAMKQLKLEYLDKAKSYFSSFYLYFKNFLDVDGHTNLAVEDYIDEIKMFLKEKTKKLEKELTNE